MGHLPLAVLTAIHLGCPQGVGARLTFDGGRGVLQAGCVGHVTDHVVRLELERVRRAVGETVREGSEELGHFLLPMCVAPRTQDAHGLVAGPERPAWGRVAFVQGQLCLAQRRLDPRPGSRRGQSCRQDAHGLERRPHERERHPHRQ